MSRVTPSPITGDHKRRSLARARAKSFPSPAGDILALSRKSKLSPTATEHFADPHSAAPMTRGDSRRGLPYEKVTGTVAGRHALVATNTLTRFVVTLHFYIARKEPCAFPCSPLTGRCIRLLPRPALSSPHFSRLHFPQRPRSRSFRRRLTSRQRLRLRKAPPFVLARRICITPMRAPSPARSQPACWLPQVLPMC